MSTDDNPFSFVRELPITPQRRIELMIEYEAMAAEHGSAEVMRHVTAEICKRLVARNDEVARLTEALREAREEIAGLREKLRIATS